MANGVTIINSRHRWKPVTGDGAFQEKTIADTASGFDAFPEGTRFVTIQVEGSGLAVRRRIDGTDPTAAVGELLPDGWTKDVNVEEANQSQFIRTGATSVTVRAVAYNY